MHGEGEGLIEPVPTEGEQKYEAKMRRHLLNFYELTERQTVDLYRRIANSNGKVRIMIHPYWERYGNKDYQEKWFQEEYPGIAAVEKGFERLATLDSELPILAFEEDRSIRKTEAQLINVNRAKGIDPEIRKFPLYIVPTFNGYGTPNLVGSDPDHLKKLYETKDPKAGEVDVQGWETLNRTLHILNVKEVLIGGMMLELYRPDPENLNGPWLHINSPLDPEIKRALLAEGVDTANLGECLGSAIRELSFLQSGENAIKITVSNLTNSISRKELIELGIVVEGTSDPFIPKPEAKQGQMVKPGEGI